jgi:predicted Zn-dependent peptidase
MCIRCSSGASLHSYDIIHFFWSDGFARLSFYEDYVIFGGECLHKEIKLDNNLTVIYERLPHVRSVSFGVWVGAGSRNETPEINGISHFIEHMVFKGTEKRTAKQIACEFDGIGGQINAFTSKDCTCFYTKTLDSDLELAIEILSDMLFHSLFERNALTTERKVIFEEINMYEDEPEEMVHDILDEAAWNGSPLGYSILGTHSSLNRINKKAIQQYMAQHYVPENCVISVVGNFEEEKLLAATQAHFGAWKATSPYQKSETRPAFQPGITYRSKTTEQTHICIGYEGVSMGDEKTFDMMILNNILGGSMSSRLFQNIREERGLVYSIYTYPTAFHDVGLFSIYAATNPDKADVVIGLIHEELVRLLADGIGETELNRSKNQLKGSYMLSLDSITGRMTALGKSKLVTGAIKTPEEILSSIDKVNHDSVMTLATAIVSGGASLAILGQSDISPSVRKLFV